MSGASREREKATVKPAQAPQKARPSEKKKEDENAKEQGAGFAGGVERGLRRVEADASAILSQVQQSSAPGFLSNAFADVILRPTDQPQYFPSATSTSPVKVSGGKRPTEIEQEDLQSVLDVVSSDDEDDDEKKKESVERVPFLLQDRGADPVPSDENLMPIDIDPETKASPPTTPRQVRFLADKPNLSVILLPPTATRPLQASEGKQPLKKTKTKGTGGGSLAAEDDDIGFDSDDDDDQGSNQGDYYEIPPKVTISNKEDREYVNVSPFKWTGPTERMVHAFDDRDLDKTRITPGNSFAGRCINFANHIPEWDRELRLTREVGDVGGQKGRLHKEHLEAALAETLIQLLKGWLLGDPWDPLILLEIVVAIVEKSGAGGELLIERSAFTRRLNFERDSLNALVIIVKMLVVLSGAYRHALITQKGDSNARQATKECMFGFIDALFTRVGAVFGARASRGKVKQDQIESFQKWFENAKNHAVKVYFDEDDYNALRKHMLKRWTKTRFDLSTIDDDTLATHLFLPSLYKSTKRGLPAALFATSVWANQRANLLFYQIDHASNDKKSARIYLGFFSIEDTVIRLSQQLQYDPTRLDALRLTLNDRFSEDPSKPILPSNTQGARWTRPQLMGYLQDEINSVLDRDNHTHGAEARHSRGNGARAMHNLLRRMCM